MNVWTPRLGPAVKAAAEYAAARRAAEGLPPGAGRYTVDLPAAVQITVDSRPKTPGGGSPYLQGKVDRYEVLDTNAKLTVTA